MIKKIAFCFVLAGLAAITTRAGEIDDTSARRIHVDVAEVVERSAVQPVDGITSAGQPGADALTVFAEAGYVAVIDLRGPEEDRGFDERAVTDELGLDYVELPIVGQEAINFDNAKKLDALIEGYEGPVLVHCGSGNRVGALLALRKSLAGADDEEALAYGRSAGLSRLEPVVKERLEEN